MYNLSSAEGAERPTYTSADGLVLQYSSARSAPSFPGEVMSTWQIIDTNADPNDLREFVLAEVHSDASHPTLIASASRWTTSSGNTQFINRRFDAACLQCAFHVQLLLVSLPFVIVFFVVLTTYCGYILSRDFLYSDCKGVGGGVEL